MDIKTTKQDIIFFDDGNSIKRKAGYITKIEEGFIYFSENGKNQLIPICRIIRIERGRG